jgi:sialic acid synthase SpsE/endonuclease IV
MAIEPIVTGERNIGPGEPVFIIAEGSINHNGSLDRAKQIIDAAVIAGADAVKFQKRNLAEVYQKKVLDNPNSAEQKYQYLIPLLKEFELPDEAFVKMEYYANERGIMFLVNPWDKESLKSIERMLHIPVYKVGSPDMTNDELLELLAATGKPMILSTGMSREEEIEHAVRLLKEKGVTFALLHANNTYPAPFDEINMSYLEILKKHGVPVGYSGHERGIAVSIGAVAKGACIIERHLTMDKNLDGPDHRASLLPDEFGQLVSGIREVEQANGEPVKKFTKIELMNREILAKSVVAATFIPDGTVITREMLTTKSPAKGLSPQRMSELINVTAQRDIFAGDVLTEDDLTSEEDMADFDASDIPWQWGPVVRFTDYEQYLQYQPNLFEFHLSDKDLDEQLPQGNFNQQLVVHAPEYMQRTYLDPSSADAEVLKVSRDTLQRAVDLTKELGESFIGTPKLIVHPGGITLERDSHPEQLLARFAETLAGLKTDGVELLPENLPPRPWVFGGEWVGNIFLLANEIAVFLQQHGYGMCFDTSHAALACHSASAQLVDQVKILRPYIKHLHISDGAGIGEEGLQVGEGTVDWPAVMKELTGYQETMVPDIWQGHLHQGRGFLQAMGKLKQYMK